MNNRKAGRKKIPLVDGMHRGFRRGMQQVPLGKVPEVRNLLMTIIGGDTKSKYLAYLCGKTIIYPEAARQIEQVFRQNGVAASKVWDE